NGKLPTVTTIRTFFDRQLEGGWLREDERARLRARGHDALPAWLKYAAKNLPPSGKYEYSFANEGVMIGQAHLSGKVDRLVFDHQLRHVTVVDIKTGKAYRK